MFDSGKLPSIAKELIQTQSFFKLNFLFFILLEIEDTLSFQLLI